jgi:hypothetical protein
MSGGGQQQAESKTQVTELPEWAKPYAKDILSKGQALTDVNQNPYQTYGAPRVAGFSPMEEQSFSGAANLAPSQAGLAGQGVALGASLGAMNTGRFGTRQAEQYMNPYLESALAPQMELMRRQQGAQGQQMAGQATLAGAFGGSRYGLAQVQQNLANQLAQQNLVGQGFNTAYQNAMAQFNADQARRLQGLQTSLQGAQTLGGLGQQQFGQQTQAIGIQNQLGGQQRALEQQGLDVAYQDFLNQQNYPYRQLGFMSDLLRGTPTGQSTTTNMYQAPPSIMGQLGGIGMGAYGLSKAGLFKEGGEVSEYALGGEVPGGSVRSESNIAQIVESLSDSQLALAMKNAQARNDVVSLVAIQKEMAQRQAEEQSFQQGVGAAMPEQFAQDAIRAAHGGIVALAGGGKSYSDMSDDELGGVINQSFANLSGKTGTPIGDVLRYKEAIRERGSREAKKDVSELQALQEKLVGADAETRKNVGAGLALAAMGAQMASEASKPGATALGSFGKASPTLVSGLSDIQKTEREIQQNNAKMQLELKKFNIASRKESEKEANDAMQNIVAIQRANQSLELQRQQIAATKAARDPELIQLAQALGGVNEENLKKAAEIKGTSAISVAGIRADAGLSQARIRGLQDQQKALGMMMNLPKGNPMGDEARAKYQALQNQIDSLLAGQDVGVSSPSPSTGALNIPQGVTIQRVGK